MAIIGVEYEGIVRISWEDVETGESGSQTVANSLTQAGIDKFVDALLKEGFSFGSGTGNVVPDTATFAARTSIAYGTSHIDQIRLGIGTTAGVLGEPRTVLSPTNSNRKNLYADAGTDVNSGNPSAGIGPVKIRAVADTDRNRRGIQIEATWGANEANSSTSGVKIGYTEAGLYMGATLFARAASGRVDKDNTRTITTTWDVTWRTS